MSELSALLLTLGGAFLVIPAILALVEFSIWLEYEKGVDVGVIFIGIIVTIGCGLLITAFIVK